MVQVQQSITTPLGLNVFGSALIRISPDIATLTFNVSNLAAHPSDSFRMTQADVQRARAYLTDAQVQDVSTSRISLESRYEHDGKKRKFVGYQSSVGFNVLIHALDQVEEIIGGLIDAGVKHIVGVSYQTTELKAYRAEARRRAVQSAIEKAQIYCEVAGVALGDVLHIEDVNPDNLRGYEGHSIRETPIDDEEMTKAFDPGSIVVKGAVMMTFALKPLSE